MDAFDFFVQMGLMGQPHLYVYRKRLAMTLCKAVAMVV